MKVLVMKSGILLEIIFLLAVTTLVGCLNESKKKQGRDIDVQHKEKPNVILFYADDLGRGLLSGEGQEIIKTPNIDRLVANYDIITTMADLLDYEISVEKDGMSFLPELIGRKSKQHDYVVYSSFMGPAIITNDGWKLRYFASEDIFQLYYLPGDYREENNLIGKHQERADQLKKILIDECNGDLYNGWYRSNSSFILPSIKNETLH